MRIRLLDLDGGLALQSDLFTGSTVERIPARAWGPRIRLACSRAAYGRFRGWLNHAVLDQTPAISFYGSGDFHHVSLALLERIPEPFNLLVLDKHPDWMRGIPFMHCGTWLRHALRLPNLRRVFHCGGELDFDNAYRRLAPWDAIETGRIVVFPARRRFTRGRWEGIDHDPVLRDGLDVEQAMKRCFLPWCHDLARFPLYVSIDKDVLRGEDAAVNWDSGLLRIADVQAVIRMFLAAAGGRLAGADVLGDWSPVALGHWLNRLCDRIDHPSPAYDPASAARRNLIANQAILEVLSSSPPRMARG